MAWDPLRRPTPLRLAPMVDTIRTLLSSQGGESTLAEKLHPARGVPTTPLELFVRTPGPLAQLVRALP